MITLAVAENPSVCNATSTEPSDPLRDTALWYPDIPPPGVFLNGEDFLSEYPHYDEEYQPLVWTLFGGLDGIYLRSLTGISIVFQRFVRAIEFHYNTDDIPTECRKMGRYRPSVQDKVTYFPIDGPGGEVIEAVELYVRATPSNVKSPGYAYGVTRLFKVGSSFFFLNPLVIMYLLKIIAFHKSRAIPSYPSRKNAGNSQDKNIKSRSRNYYYWVLCRPCKCAPYS